MTSTGLPACRSAERLLSVFWVRQMSTADSSLRRMASVSTGMVTGFVQASTFQMRPWMSTVWAGRWENKI